MNQRKRQFNDIDAHDPIVRSLALPGPRACFDDACFDDACFDDACLDDACFDYACFDYACFDYACFARSAQHDECCHPERSAKRAVEGRRA